MANIVVGKKDEMVMKILHYFVTEENYRPIIVNGVQNEIWLENLENDISLIRININYIHNEEQLMTDMRKVSIIRKTIKKKTYSFKMHVLNILLDVRDEVNLIEDKNIDSVKINKINDLKKNDIINTFFPKFRDKVMNKNAGIMGMFQMTEELNDKTNKDDKKLAKVFRNNRLPVVTISLIVINIIVYLISMISVGNYEFMINTFANYYVNVQKGEVWRLVTSIFVHTGLLHLLCNMVTLYAVGPIAERYYGKIKYLLIYIGSGILGSLLSVVLSNYASVGASGAIYGLFASIIFFGYKYRATLDGFLRSNVVPVVIINLILSFMIPGIDVFGHIGGLVGGFLFSYALCVPSKEKVSDHINGFIITIILFIALGYLLIIKK